MKTLNFSKKGNEKPDKENRHFHKKLLSLLLSFLIVFGVLKVDLDVTHAAVPTKTVTHKITDTDWISYKKEGPAHYYYDDGVYSGTINRVSTTWQKSRATTSRTGKLNGTTREGMERDEVNYEIGWLETFGYENPKILNEYWTSAVYDDYIPSLPAFPYARDYYIFFEYDAYKFTSTYSGLVEKKNYKPTLNIFLKENRYFDVVSIWV